jgi:hypothetical protein
VTKIIFNVFGPLQGPDGAYAAVIQGNLRAGTVARQRHPHPTGRCPTCRPLSTGDVMHAQAHTTEQGLDEALGWHERRLG